MTRPRVRRDWLIMPASLARLSAAPDRPILSEPAKSTRFSLPTRSISSPSVVSLICTVIVKTVCERLRQSQSLDEIPGEIVAFSSSDLSPVASHS